MAEEESRKKRRRPNWWRLLKALISVRIRTGILVVVPLAFTVWVLQLVFNWLDGLLGPLARHAVPAVRRLLFEGGAGAQQHLEAGLSTKVTAALNAHDYPALRQLLGSLDSDQIPGLLDKVNTHDLALALYHLVPDDVWAQPDIIPGVGFVALLLLLYLVGFFTSVAVGGRVVALFDRFLEKVPISRTIYTASKKIVNVFGGSQRRHFQRPVLIHYPVAPLNALAFVTNNFHDDVTNRDMTCVFLPTTPNPTSGFYLIVPAEDVRDVALDVEQAVGQIMSDSSPPTEQSSCSNSVGVST